MESLIFKNGLSESEMKTFKQENFIATFYLKSTVSLKDAAWNLAIGQSVGNPKMRSIWETDELFINYSCKIMGDENELEKVKEGNVDIAFPIVNTNWKEDGITQLLVQVMGGQTDIASIIGCRLLKLEFPEEVRNHFKGPKFGIQKTREFVNVFDKPLFGAIVKPKTGITPQVLLEMVKELVEGGVNFIKEDEILSNPSFCTIEERVPLIMDYINNCGRNVVYCVCINADYPYVVERVKKVHELGGNGVHINFWNGLGVYKTVRELDLPIYVHYQTSGYKILTDKSHRFSIDFRVICQIAGMSGCDFFHCGMLFGYSGDTEQDILDYVSILRSHGVCPTLSCGLTAENVNLITEKLGNDYLANSGGGIHSHPKGSKYGALAIKEKIDNYKKE